MGDKMKNFKILLFAVIVLFIHSVAYSQSITVTSPNGGESWQKGTSHNITWTSSGITTGTFVVLLFDGTTNIGTIQAGIPCTDGAHSIPWIVGNLAGGGTASLGSNFKIKVRQASLAPKDFSDAPFTISEPGGGPTGSITVINPHTGSSWCKGSTYAIQWKRTGTMSANVLINIFKNSINPANSVEQLTGLNSGLKNWTIPNSYTNGTYYIRVKTDDNAVYGDSSNFGIVRRNLVKADPIVITSPSQHEKTNWKAGKRAYVKWKTYGIKKNTEMRILLYQADGRSIICELGRGSNGIFRWEIPETLGGDYTIKVTKAGQSSGIKRMVAADLIFDVSHVFHITPIPKTIVLKIKPDILNRYSRKQRQYTLKRTDPQQVRYKNKAGLARVGFRNTYYTHISEWIVNMFLFRSRLYFDLSPIKKKRVIILEATLLLDTKENYGNTAAKYAADRLYFLTSRWEKAKNKCYETPGYLYKPVPQQHNARIDILDKVIDWRSGAEHNYGLLLSGPHEHFLVTQKNKDFRVTYYLPTLILKFREYPE
jgi:hypothetical protein